MVIGEAMAAGVPVVATRVGGVPYLVDEGSTGHVVEAGDVGALADRITRVAGDPSAAAALGRAGRAKADGSYRVEAVAARVHSVYEEVACAIPAREATLESASRGGITRSYELVSGTCSGAVSRRRMARKMNGNICAYEKKRKSRASMPSGR